MGRRPFLRRARLRVGIPAELTRLSPATGHGKVWSGALGELKKSVRLVPVERRPRRRPPRVDVWLGSAADPPPEGDAPFVAELHEAGWTESEQRRFLNPEFVEVLDRAVRASLKVAARVITISHAAGAQIASAYGLEIERVHPVWMGVDHTVFHPGVPGGADLVQRTSGDRRPYVLFVGTLVPRKNIPALREAVAGLVARGHPHALVLVAGDAPDRGDSTDLRAAAEADLPGAPGRVVALRSVGEGELAALMGEASALCLPSFSEGFGLPVLEAMACGCPVVVSDRGALPEVVGDAGLVVEPSPAGIEGAFTRVVEEPELADRLRAQGVARAAEFTWRRTADGWLEALERAVEER